MKKQNISLEKVLKDLKLAKSLDMFIVDEDANRFGIVAFSKCDLCGQPEPNVNVYFCLDESQKSDFTADYCSCSYYEFGSTCWMKKIKPLI
jgi:hypothetical protein